MFTKFKTKSAPLHQWLKPLLLNNGLILPHRIMPGPMEGIMKPLFCKTVSELNLVDYWITPFISVNSAPVKPKSLKYKLKYFQLNTKPVIVQLMGTNPEFITETITNLKEIGISAVNINFACPSKKVLSSGSGGKLLNTPEKMNLIIEAILKKHDDISLSLKLRAGYSDESEMKFFLPSLAKYNPDFIMFHFRTVLEMYKNIDNGVERTKKAVVLAGKVPVIASGDVFSSSSAEHIFSKSNCSGITVARGLFRDPYLIKKIKTSISSDNELQVKEPQKIFLQKMSELAKKEPVLYNRNSFIEIVKCFYGKTHPFFTNLKNISDIEMINFF